MNSKTRRMVKLLIVCLLCGGVAWQLFYTDKRSATGPVEAPLRWLDEETLLSVEKGSLFLRTQGAPRREIYTLAPPANMFSSANACISEKQWWLNTLQKTVTGFVRDLRWIGPISLEVGTGTNGQITIQKTARYEMLVEPCPRKTQRLISDEESRYNLELPRRSFVEIKWGYSCFSCGCGCYAHLNFYVVGENIYAHVYGYPVVNKRRGVYRLNQTGTGPHWKKIVSGRPQPPLAFSPSGEKVAYFEISRLGDSFVIADIAGHN